MPVIETSLAKESRDRYLTYALSVVSGRALPDVRDGLKPVQRRILYAMAQSLRLTPSQSHRKSAAVVGEVLAKFHPHGDLACYEAMVRMAQEFSLRYPLVDGQGNFGSLDGDNAAAYRYTEARLRPLAIEVLGEIEEETVGFRANFDGTTEEPLVLPSKVPNLLMNGASGIAVGMATSIPPHNLRELVKALVELANDPEIIPSKIANIIKGPDFPSGCLILNTRKELSEIYKTGRGAIRMRCVWDIEEQKRGKRVIVITAIPYAVNKSQLVEKIANLIIEKKVPQLSDVRDESTEHVRIVLELSSGADAEVAMAYLFKHTALDTNFAVNMTVLVPGQTGACVPQLLSLKECLQQFLVFRNEVVQKRLVFEKKILLERIHLLDGLMLIYDALDEALKIVRKSNGRSDAAEKLRVRFKLSEIQAFAIVDMRIYQLSKTNIEEIREEYAAKTKRVKEIEATLKNKGKISSIVCSELEEIAEKYGDKRLCKLETENLEVEFKEEDYVVHEDVFAIVTRDGWVKRIRQTNELGSTRLREGDAILEAHALSTTDAVAIFTSHGSLYVLKVSEFPSSSGYGDPVQKILKFKDGETIVRTFPFKASANAEKGVFEGQEVILVSANGVGFILKIEGLEGIKRNGKRVIKVRSGDALAAVCPLYGPPAGQIALFTANGSGLAIEAKEVPVRDSAAVGVALMGVRGDDKLVGVIQYKGATRVKLALESGKEKEIESAEIVEGHRALKGNKVISRDRIIGVKKVA